MADKYINETGLQTIKTWANGKFAKDADLDTLSDRVDDIVAEGGEPNTIESISVNGTTVTPDANRISVLCFLGRCTRLTSSPIMRPIIVSTILWYA